MAHRLATIALLAVLCGCIANGEGRGFADAAGEHASIFAFPISLHAATRTHPCRHEKGYHIISFSLIAGLSSSGAPPGYQPAPGGTGQIEPCPPGTAKR